MAVKNVRQMAKEGSCPESFVQNRPRPKTKHEWCKYILESRVCPFGTKCAFMHTQSDAGSPRSLGAPPSDTVEEGAEMAPEVDIVDDDTAVDWLDPRNKDP